MKPHRVTITLIATAAAIIAQAALANLPTQAASGLDPTAFVRQPQLLVGNPDFILLRRGPINTRAAKDLDTAEEDLLADSGARLQTSSTAERGSRIVQFAGPVKREWFERLKSTGCEIAAYLPTNAYLILGTRVQIAKAAGLHSGDSLDDSHPIRWMGRFEPTNKVTPAIDDELLAGFGSIQIEIELFDTPDATNAINYIHSVSSTTRAPRRFLKYLVLSVEAPARELLNIARFDDVLFIDTAFDPQPLDERSVQIAAGNLSRDYTQPAGPGYLDWLRSKRLDWQPDFLIDITDTGLDRGSTDPLMIHPDFRDRDEDSRVVYNVNYYTADGQIDDRAGHGSIVASVACGSGLSEVKDAAGYLFGLGLDPFVRLGASRIFNEKRKLPLQLSFTQIAASAYAAGARISNNSWGDATNAYGAASQEFDSLTRDAQPAIPGNQEMSFIFSAGNSGAGRISSPGTAKNVVTVGASESYRPEGQDGCDPDGEGPIGPDGADSALDILRFSSGGPTSDGRAKPDITAPGTHIFGAASKAPLFNAGALCPGTPIYQPPGQRLFTWSSGTSLAAPHISGAAALVRRFFTANSLLESARPPSPAMVKAFLLNSASYLTGENGGGDLPGPRQGWGLVNLSHAFDTTRRVLIDQTTLFTESEQSFEVQGSIADRSRPLRVTLVWTDASGTLAGPTLVNDLDLEVTVGGQTVYRGNHFAAQYSATGGEPDRLNNVEAIYLKPDALPAGFEGNFTITVRAANIAGDGVPGNSSNSDLDQDFALVVSNIADPIPRPRIPVITSATYERKVLKITGRDFTAAARVEINGRLIEDSFEFDATTGSLSVRKKARKLGLAVGMDNQIVLLENAQRSQPFTLRL